MNHRRSTALLAVALAALLLAGRLAANDFKEDFKKGMEAADRKRWDEAASHFRAAIAKNATESEERVFLSGVFSAPYLPHFQLGRSLYEASRDNCREALSEWEASESQGAIQTFDKSFEELTAAKGDCNGLLLPAAVDGATDAFTRADSVLRQLPAQLADDGLERQRQQLTQRLAAARGELRRGQGEAGLELVESAAETARDVAADLEELARRQTSAAEPDTFVAETEGSIADARSELESLQMFVEQSEARDVLLADDEIRGALALGDRIDSFTERLDGADRSTARTLAASADEAARQIRRARQRATRRTEEAARPEPEPESGTDPDSDSKQGTAREPEAARSEPESSPLAVRLGRLLVEAEDLLEATRDQISTSRLLSSQHDGLSELVGRGADAESAAVATLSRRIAASSTALRFMAAAQRLFSGQPETALTLLEDQDEWPEPAAAQAHLMRGAARFALSRRAAEADPRVTARAAEDVRRASELDPELRPAPELFSPAFLRFYETYAAEP